jgi:hypothetical protein
LLTYSFEFPILSKIMTCFNTNCAGLKLAVVLLVLL